MNLAALEYVEVEAYEAARAAQQAAIAMLDSMGRRPASKARRAAYDAAVEREIEAKAAWGVADQALRAAKRIAA